ncbi:hypothetical protein C6H88_00145 [Chlamydia muridarum str. Nigg]|uniref:Uncharacterized protein n=2 Tax=Chlamydia muridarum TaxID=83560 RepID=A0A069ZXR2_CHLMR|nr:hypothetical protein [Chlamydia muridarum]UFU85959.1 hypothetical protein FTN29_00155 [Chlamydia trachomatis]AAF38919.1 conserved hypothetical protein [Chlamydia muridarum str. Nigg]AHH22427.1 hypothetical protein TAC_00145 [Chlamydia muridarum str. Nigg3 CMUT3-5]AHH23351.1 hypothetical protein Y015_00145 [Chlamydia muridarum str. Nigg CM972]AID37580.1 hypothetical protein BB17_00150 [Chlamydia muridarum str. Nigg 2 MCR]
MDILHFLAVPLDEEEMQKLANCCEKFQFDAEKYLIPIRYKQSVYLAKPIRSFPMTIETWELHVRHVMSMLRQQFSFLLNRDPILLVCESKLVMSERVLNDFVKIP